MAILPPNLVSGISRPLQTVCTVVWEDGGGDPASYPILDNVPVSRYQRIGATNPFSEPFEASIGYS